MTAVALGLAAGALQVVAYTIYTLQVVRAECRPNGMTWLMWSYGTLVLLIIEWDVGAPISILILPAVCSVCSLFVAGYAFARSAYIANARTGTMVQNAWEYIQGYGSNAYSRPELALRTLERHLGEPTFARAMREYHQRWRYRHPTSRDFFDVVEEVCACDLSLFWDQMVLGDSVADFAVISASSRLAEPPRGRFWRDGEWVIVEGGRSEDETPEAGAAEDERIVAGAATPIYETRVVVQRLEDFVWPVDVVLHFEDGSERLEVWDGRDRLHAIEHTGPSRLEWAAVDPSNKLPLDINQLNNSRVLREDPEPRQRWTRRWLFWMANLLFAASGSL